MKKYKLTKTTKEYLGTTLYQIEAIMGFSNVKKGDLGGWIEKEENLSQVDNCWVFGNAQVYDDAQVSGDARVFGNAQVYDDAQVSGDAQVYGNARVSDNTWVSDDAQVSGDAQVYGNARVFGNLKLIGGYFYHYKEKSEEIEKVEVDEDYELLCREPKLAEEASLAGKKVKIKVKDQIIEGELIEE